MKSVRLTPTSVAVLKTIRNRQDATSGGWVSVDHLPDMIPEWADGCLNILTGIGYLELNDKLTAVKITAAGRNALTDSKRGE